MYIYNSAVPVVFFFLWRHHRKKEKELLDHANDTSTISQIENGKPETKISAEQSISPNRSSSDILLEHLRNDSWVIPRDDLEICKDADGNEVILGKGGYGMVVKAIKGGVQEVALKIVQSDDEDVARACRQEAEIMKLLHDGNVVHLYGVSTEGTKLLLVMEFMAGGDLAKALSDKKLKHHFSWNVNGKKIALDIIKGISYLHGRRLIHRDIKTRNIFLDEQKTTAKVGDVGVSRILEEEGQLTVVGTMAYIAPEILARIPYDYKADIYSFGVVRNFIIQKSFFIFWLCFRPFEILSQVLREMVTRQSPSTRGPNRDPIPGEECPQEICDLIRACLSSNPSMFVMLASWGGGWALHIFIYKPCTIIVLTFVILLQVLDPLPLRHTELSGIQIKSLKHIPPNSGDFCLQASM